jgi:hypothetical protein
MKRRESKSMKKTYKMKALKVKMKMKMQKACNPIKI